MVASGVISHLAPGIAPALLVVVALGWPLPLLLGIGWLAHWRPRRDAVRVHVDEGGLRVGGATVRARGKLRRGDATVLGDGSVRVKLRAWLSPTLLLDVQDAGAARELLGSLGLDRRRGTSQFRVRRLRAYFNWLVLSCLLFAVPASALVASVSPWAGLFVLLAVAFTPLLEHVIAGREITVGSDGLRITSPLGHALIPHRRIRKVTRIWPRGDENGSRHEGEVVSWGFAIELDDGEELRFDTRGDRFPAGTWRTDPVFDAVLEAWAASRTMTDAPAHASASASALLGRDGRSTRDWVASLRALTGGAARGYRAPAIDERALFAVLGDAEAPRHVRAAAAVALGATETHAPRLRIAADALADPVVRRVALASAERVSEAQIEAELDEVSSATERSGTRSR